MDKMEFMETFLRNIFNDTSVESCLYCPLHGECDRIIEACSGEKLPCDTFGLIFTSTEN